MLDERVLHIGNMVRAVDAAFSYLLIRNECTISSSTTPYFFPFHSPEATKLQEKLTKLERQSRVRDAMMEISSEISGFKKRQTQEYGLSHGSASISFDIEEINVTESHEHDVSAICGEDDMVKPTQVSP